MTHARTLVVATPELLRARPATNLEGYTALEVVRVGRSYLWRCVPDGEVAAHAHAWAEAHGVTAMDFEPETVAAMSEFFPGVNDTEAT